MRSGSGRRRLCSRRLASGLTHAAQPRQKWIINRSAGNQSARLLSGVLPIELDASLQVDHLGLALRKTGQHRSPAFVLTWPILR